MRSTSRFVLQKAFRSHSVLHTASAKMYHAGRSKAKRRDRFGRR
jgi:hypothetical protein